MKILLLLNTLFELAIGVLMLVMPTLFFPDLVRAVDQMALSYALVRGFAFAALAIAGLSGLMVLRPLTPEVRFSGLGALALFHLGLTITQLMNVIEGLVPIPVLIIHGVFALVFWAAFIWSWR
ncbi:MAG: hypothetical protein SF052_26980 [Bacteroidia bacterium]|nr:hypothetical protein [Bacteroidia bacterium]